MYSLIEAITLVREIIQDKLDRDLAPMIGRFKIKEGSQSEPSFVNQ